MRRQRPIGAHCSACLRALAALCLAAAPAVAGVLPPDRADALYHRYEGGGITVQGPSVLVQKKIGDHFSIAVGKGTRCML